MYYSDTVLQVWQNKKLHWSFFLVLIISFSSDMFEWLKTWTPRELGKQKEPKYLILTPRYKPNMQIRSAVCGLKGG